MRVTWLVLLSTGCIEFGLGRIDEEPPLRVVVEDMFVQSATPAVDLLFVVDNTASMATEQEALADDFQALFVALSSADVAWQAGVVTTDLTGEQAGWLQGSPWVITASLDDAPTAFATAVQVGVESTAPEAGLGAAILALQLSETGEVNAGFRRSSAPLHVVFVSDDDDASEEWFGEEPVFAFLQALDELAPDAVVSAIVGDAPDGCSSLEGSARPGLSYLAVAQATGGHTASICRGDFLEILQSVGDASYTYSTRFPLRSVPDRETVQVAVNGDLVEEGWVVLTSPPTIVFEDPPSANAQILVTYVTELE